MVDVLVLSSDNKNKNARLVQNRKGKYSSLWITISLSLSVVGLPFLFGYLLGESIHQQPEVLTAGDDTYANAPRAIEGTRPGTGKKEGGLRGRTASANTLPDDLQMNESEHRKWSTLPANWETYSHEKMRRHFECHSYENDKTMKPLPTLEYWHVLQQKIKEHVDPTANFDDPVPPTEGYTLGLLGKNEGPVPFYAAHSKDSRGRGVFASRDIKKGELVHDGDDSHSDVTFPDGMSFRRLVFNVSRTVSCDILMWAWTQKLEKNGNLHIIVSPNVSILMNSGYGRPGNTLPPDDISRKMRAMRDIEKGEEIIMNYSMYETNWRKVGL